MKHLALLLLLACTKPAPYLCAIDPDCGVGAFCEQDGGCSVSDDTCPSGRRYSDLGPNGGACVEGTSVADEAALCNVTAARPTGSGTCAALVCDADPSCCAISWDQQCARMAESHCEIECAPEIIAAGGFRLAAAFALDTPATKLWSENHSSWNLAPAWGDIDGDGLPDLAMGREANGDGPGLRIYRNTGRVNGNLVLTAVTIAGAPIDTIRMLAWRDFDADGDLDLLASGNGLYLIVTEGTTFTSHQLSATNAEVNATWLNTSAVAPWRIGVVDVMAATVSTYEVSDTYALSSPTSLGTGGDDVTWCHVTGDASRDFLVGGRIFTANADGFSPATDASASGYLPACVDLNGDRNNDLVLGDYDGVHIVMNNGGLTSDPISFLVTFPDYFGIADFDRDGRMDILVSSAETSDGIKEIPLRLIENREDGFMPREIFPDWNTADLDSRGLDIGRMPK